VLKVLLKLCLILIPIEVRDESSFRSITSVALLGQQLNGCDLNRPTPLRSNMKDEQKPSFVRLLSRFRRLIETVIGQLCERFNLETVWARDLWHLTSRLNRKLLAHTVCFWLNRHSCEPLQFDQLIPE
jgi:hypothetical protein